MGTTKMAEEFISQFGDTLHLSSDDTTTSPSSALTGKDFVLLYFSAKWCGPCRNFTPRLIEFYNKLKSSKNLEIVFCSLDSDEEEYKAYSSKMPWLSMPFEAKETKLMARKYNAEGIPHLVVIDGATGEVITEDGTEGVREDEDGTNFPWKPKSFGEVWPSKVLSSKGSEDEFLQSDTLKDKYLMLYFSAHWCPPCRMFTPELSKAYTKMKAERSDFELVFVSSDRDEGAFKEYFDSMSFCALPYEHREAKNTLSKMCGVQGIPTLTILGPVSDESGNRPIINKNIRKFIQNEEFSEFPFHKKNYGDVNSADEIESTKSLVIFHEGGDDDEQDQIKEIAKQVASKIKEDEKHKDMDILWALSDKGLGPRIRQLTGLPKVSEDPSMLILDLPDEGGYYKSDVTDITVENVMAFIKDSGARLQL